ncbi:25472_t:CDS:2 [Gigaspora rosea]|nr:25472_t:CDS:2 [Gigaspora rosea]
MTDESLTPTNDDDFKLYNKILARYVVAALNKAKKEEPKAGRASYAETVSIQFGQSSSPVAKGKKREG